MLPEYTGNSDIITMYEKQLAEKDKELEQTREAWDKDITAKNLAEKKLVLANDKIERLRRANQWLHHDLYEVSKLASDKPEFFNPIKIAEARKIRDRVLTKALEGEKK